MESKDLPQNAVADCRTANRRSGWGIALAVLAAWVVAACQPAEDAVVPKAAGPAPTTVAPATQTYRVPPNYAAAAAPSQPVPFSHAVHAGTMGLPCANCHVGAGPTALDDPRTAEGAHMTLPDSSTCMACHQGVASDRPAIQRLAEFDRAGGDVPWVRVYRVLDGVNWSHRPHVQGGLACQDCHGDVASMEAMSMATAVTAMGSCLGCHRSGQANADCVTCHSWPGTNDL